MDISELEDVKDLHHAYLVVGGGSEDVLKLLKKRGVETAGNADVLSLSFSELLVDDVRDTVLPFASLAPVGGRKYVILSFSRANDQAQNALLKGAEEGIGKTVFFFCVDSQGHVLPTLKSRCIVVSAGSAKTDEKNEDAEAFAKAGFEKRLSSVEKMTGYISKTQDRAPVRAFVKGLMEHYHRAGAPARTLRELMDADRYLRMQGGSAKAVLSHLAVSLPKA